MPPKDGEPIGVIAEAIIATFFTTHFSDILFYIGLFTLLFSVFHSQVK